MLDKSTVMLGTSAAMRSIEREIDVSAACRAKVLITGESGVGKELVARLIHEGSAQRANKFVAINCAGLPDSLLESELFGHVRGSFTGAYRDKKGWLEAAHGGTIFLDEVGEMSLRMQAMLLRFLETGEIQRVGSHRALPPLDVRVIAATHRNLSECVRERTFREDLYYRLNVVHIEVPPLRQRRSDIPVLLKHFLSMFSSAHRLPVPEVAPDAMQRLANYDWPGNVRELKNLAERLVVGSRSGGIETNSLPSDVSARSTQSAPRSDVALAASSTFVSAPVGPLMSNPSVWATSSTLQQRLDRLMKERVSFWSEVYEPFMNHDITREDVRQLVRQGLAHTRGNYTMLVRAFNMDQRDYKRFLSFLRTYKCHVSFRPFRMMGRCADGANTPWRARSGDVCVVRRAGAS
jgi:DNA-binding NtrC family response regulator